MVANMIWGQLDNVVCLLCESSSTQIVGCIVNDYCGLLSKSLQCPLMVVHT